MSQYLSRFYCGNKEGLCNFSEPIQYNKILDRKPDLCISGINHGSNSSINVIYSGTMSAAVEGALEGIPSVGFSLLDFSFDADFTASKNVAADIIRMVLKEKLPKGICLNVNIPKLPFDKIKGYKIFAENINYLRNIENIFCFDNFINFIDHCSRIYRNFFSHFPIWVINSFFNTNFFKFAKRKLVKWSTRCCNKDLF